MSPLRELMLALTGALALVLVLIAPIPAYASGDAVNVTKSSASDASGQATGKADSPHEQASEKDGSGDADASSDTGAPPDAGLDEFINAALEGYTGLINIPTADVLPEGRARFAYTVNNSLSPNATYAGQRTVNGAVSLGYFSWAEVGIRWAVYPRVNFDFPRFGNYRDRSYNVKLRVYRGKRDALAVGATNPFGFATTSRINDSSYVVYSRSFGRRVRAHVGAGTKAVV